MMSVQAKLLTARLNALFGLLATLYRFYCSYLVFSAEKSMFD